MRAFALVVLVCVSAQLDSSASEYPIQGQDQAPLTKDVIFTVNDMSNSAKNQLPYANVVIGIISAPYHFQEREAVRDSWLQFLSLTDPKLNKLTLEDKKSAVVRFIIGESDSSSIESQLAREALKYHDIVRVPVKESYFNLTLKTGEFLKWADATYKFDWAMKCDDDSFVRLDLLLQDLKQRQPSRTYIGKMWTGTPVDRRVDSWTPWAQYHTFAAGAGYVLSSDLVAFITRNYDQLVKISMEDVAVGTWLSGVELSYVDHPHFHSLPEGCDNLMIVQNPANITVIRETFFNSVKGIPCHAQPDPFDPKTKNVTDHVLLELGIPKTHPSTDSMKMIGAQSLIVDVDSPNEMGVDMGDDTAGHDSPDSIVEADGMSDDAMNNNMPTSQAVQDMNSSGRAEGSEKLDQAANAALDRMNYRGTMEMNLI